MVAQNEQGPGKHNGHAEEEDEEDDDHCDRRHHRVALLDVIVEVFAVAEFVAVAVSDLISEKRRKKREPHYENICTAGTRSGGGPCPNQFSLIVFIALYFVIKKVLKKFTFFFILQVDINYGNFKEHAKCWKRGPCCSNCEGLFRQCPKVYFFSEDVLPYSSWLGII